MIFSQPKVSVAAVQLAWSSAPIAFVASIILAVAAGAASAPAAWIARLLVNNLADQHASAATVEVEAILAALLAASALALTYIQGAIAARLQGQIEIRAELELVRASNRQIGIGKLERQSTREAFTLAQQSTVDAPMAITFFSCQLLIAGSTLGTYFFILWLRWPYLAVALVIVGLSVLGAQATVARRAVQVSESSVDAHRWREYYTFLATEPRAAQEIRLFGLASFIENRLSTALQRAINAETSQQVRSQLLSAVIALVNGCVAAAGAVIVVSGVMKHRLQVGDFVLFTAAVAALQNGLTSLTANMSRSLAALGRFKNYIEVTQMPSELADGVAVVASTPSTITFSDVWFRYSDQSPWVLRGISFDLQPGHALGLVGENGAGKSTIVKLLLRLYDPQKGSITWNGIDLRTLSASSLRERISGVLQEFVPYELSVVDNVAIGDVKRPTDISMANDRLDGVGLSDLISTLPSGLNTLLSASRAGKDGRAGTQLSGGQWQRISIARALYKQDAELLVLDEPSSGLDPQAEHDLRKTLMRAGDGRCRLLISHRLGMVRLADTIVVLHEGLVVERGAHDDLIALDGTYARLFRLQSAYYQREVQFK